MMENDSKDDRERGQVWKDDGEYTSRTTVRVDDGEK